MEPLFFYLDGGSQDFPWVLQNQNNVQVLTRIHNLLGVYNAAGVNYLRLLVATDHFPSPPPSTLAVISMVNNFMNITRSVSGASFTIELVLIPHQQNGLFVNPISQDKAWYKLWFDNLNYANLGIIMLGGDLSPCLLSGCQGESGAAPLAVNHGNWIKSIWNWKQANYPAIGASYEVIGVQMASNNNSTLLPKLAQWMNTNTPSNPVIAASLYLEVPAGSSWSVYAAALLPILDAYHAVSSKTLWIDEFGRSISPSNNRTAADQESAISGFLAASVCWRQNRYPKFAWVAGNDYPYSGSEWFGLVSGFSTNSPIMRPAWSSLSLYYNLQQCP